MTAARPQKLIIAPTQQIGFIISFKKIRVNIKVKIGADAIMKLLTPAETLTEPVVNRYEYKKTPESPLSKNIGRSLTLGVLIFFIIPKTTKVMEAATKRSTIIETGL